MIDGKFDIVFRGQIIRNMDESQVKQNLVSLFKSTDAAVEKLFGGNEVVVRKSLDYSTAMKYQSALKKAGALALIKEIVEEKPTPDPAINSRSGRASFGSEDDNEHSSQSKPIIDSSPSKPISSQSSVQAGIMQSEVTSNDSADSSELSLASVGVQIIPDKIYEKKQVDTSELSLAAAGERLLPKKAAESYPQPSIDHLSLE